MKTTKQKNGGKLITDCAHLIDLPPIEETFNVKDKGNVVQNASARIRVLKSRHPKNGLSNLL